MHSITIILGSDSSELNLRFVLRLEAMNQFAARRKAGLDNTEDTRSGSSCIND